MAHSDIAVVLFYLIGVFILGVLFTRRAHEDTNSYFLSSRRLPWWIAGTSMVATSFSCDTPLYVTQLVRSGGVWLNWQWWSFAIGGMLSAFLLSRFWRRAKVVTDVELTELRYGSGVGSVLRVIRAGWMALLINTIGMSWVILAMAKIIGAIWGGEKWAGVLISTTLAISYSFLAGFWGVVVTDVAQFIVAMAGAIVLAVFSVHAAGGMGVVLAAAGPERLHLVPSIPTGGLADPGFWTGAFGGFLVYLSIQWWANVNSDGGGKVIQRMSATKNEAHAFGATLWFNLAHYGLRTWPWVITALASLVLLPELADAESAYPMLILMVLPSPWKGVLLAGLVAAFMSTIDTQLNWGASYLTSDLYRRWLAPGRSEKHYLIAAKFFMLLLVAVTSVMAYYVQSVTAAFTFLIAFGAGAGPVYVLRWFWWRLNAWSEIAAMTASTVISSVLYLAFPEIPFPLKVVTVAMGSALIWLPVTFLTRPVPMIALLEFYQRTQPPGAWSHVRRMMNRRRASTTQSSQLGRDLWGWLSGTALVLGTTFSLGKMLLGEPFSGGIWLMIAAAGGVGTWQWFRRLFR
ncbi:MAG: sodium:solute symporter family protein [bacterium]